MIFLGIDPSMTNTGLVALDDKGDIQGLMEVKSESMGPNVSRRMQRIHEAIKLMLDFINNYDPQVACIESYSFASKSSSTSQICEFGGVLRYLLWKRSTNLYEVAPTQLKKWASGKGNGDKTPTIAGIVSRYNVSFDSNDLFDAYALSRMAMQIGGAETGATLSQRQTVQLVLHPKPKVKKKRGSPSA